ncbi:MAG: hypothetical protein OEM41_04540 [Ignavibacteria bacterium]|nr:hypothetical protein [Ignavibacteria bacterium]
MSFALFRNGLLVAALWSCSAAYAQEGSARGEPGSPPPDSVFSRNTASVVFERNINTFDWIGRVVVDTTIAGTGIRVIEQYSSNIIRIDESNTQQGRKQQSNQQNLLVNVDVPAGASVSGLGRWSSLVNSDNRSVGRGDKSIHSVLGGVQYTPVPELVVQPMLGYRWEDQLGNRDHGISYDLAAMSRGVDLEGFRLTGEGRYQRDELDPRTLEGITSSLGAEKRFLGLTRDSLAMSFRRYQREYYALSANVIESRDERIFGAGNLLDYEVNNNIIASFFGAVSERALKKTTRDIIPVMADSAVRFGTTIDEFLLEAGVRTAYRSDDGRTRVDARFSYNERTESHAALLPGETTPGIEALFRTRNEDERTKDNLTRRTSLFGSVAFPLSLSHALRVSGGASILRYDTPSEFNVEDRDELLAIMSLTSYHRLGPHLDVSLTLEGNISHVVYLLSENSANNNINRVLRFLPRTLYRPSSGIITMNAFEVLANYTVYDFEERLSRIRSFAYRQFAWIDSTSVDITSRVGLDFFAYLKLYERGQLRWDEFTERTENSFVEKTYEVQARFAPLKGLRFAVGLRYFSQSRFAHDGAERRLDAFFRSVGPTCAIVWETNSQNVVGLRGWYENRRQTDGSRRSIANMSLIVQLHF